MRYGLAKPPERNGAIAGFVTILTRVRFREVDEPPGEYALVSDLVLRRAIAVVESAPHFYARPSRAAGAHELRGAVLSGNRAAASLYSNARFAPYLETLAKRLDEPST